MFRTVGMGEGTEISNFQSYLAQELSSPYDFGSRRLSSPESSLCDDEEVTIGPLLHGPLSEGEDSSGEDSPGPESIAVSLFLAELEVIILLIKSPSAIQPMYTFS
jgi:hypothetical protein